MRKIRLLHFDVSEEVVFITLECQTAKKTTVHSKVRQLPAHPANTEAAIITIKAFKDLFEEINELTAA